MYEKTTLSNGLSLATHHMPSRVSVSLGVWLKVGARYEEKNINGISHFLEHLLFKGTKKRSSEQLKQSIERYAELGSAVKAGEDVQQEISLVLTTIIQILRDLTTLYEDFPQSEAEAANTQRIV